MEERVVDMSFDAEEELKKILERKPSGSLNYRFCNFYLPRFFFYQYRHFLDVFDHQEKLSELLSFILGEMHEDGYDVEPYLQLAYLIKIDREHRIIGIVLELPDAKVEPECNFVCLCFPLEDKGPRYFESELYSDGSFGLCSRDMRGTHSNHGFIGGDIKTAEDMWNAVVEVAGRSA